MSKIFKFLKFFAKEYFEVIVGSLLGILAFSFLGIFLFPLPFLMFVFLIVAIIFYFPINIIIAIFALYFLLSLIKKNWNEFKKWS